MLIVCFSIGAIATPVADTVIKIGVLAYRGKDKTMLRWQQTADYLSTQLKSYQFQIVPLNLPELTQAVKDNKLSFTLTNPGHYVLLESKFGISRIVTKQTEINNQLKIRFGAAIFTRADNRTIKNLDDLKNKRFMAVSPHAFGGFQMAWLELSKHNIDPFSDFSELKFSGFPQDQIALAVYNRQIDAGTIRSETLVRMINEGIFSEKDFRILNIQKTDAMHTYVSTQLYPEWPFSKNKNTSRALAKQVAQTLLSMPKDDPAAQTSNTAGWTVPLDYSPVHKLMKSLAIEPYAIKQNTSLRYILTKYFEWLVSAILFVAFLILINAYISRTNRRLKIIEKQLRSEIEEREISQNELSQYKDTLERRVESRTTQLMNNNRALLASQNTLHELVDISIESKLSYKEKLKRLLEIGREYYQLPIAILSSLKTDDNRLCLISSHKEINTDKFRALDFECAKKIIERKGQALDIPDISVIESGIDVCNRSNLKSYLASAVFVNGEAHCILEFLGEDVRENEYTKWDHNLLQVMGQWIGSEIEKQYAVDEKQQHQAELYRVSRMNVMGEMAANLAHELNQPLTAACNYSSVSLRLLKKDSFDKNKILSALTKTIESASMASDIIRQLREFLQKGDNQLIKLQLNDLVYKLIDLVSSDINLNSVKLKLDLKNNLPDVQANIVQIEQVILNFIRNSIDAMKNSTSNNRLLCITTEEKNNSVRLSVTDNGMGINEADKIKVFDAFYTTKSDGMGMGLSISRSIIEAHEGIIDIMPINEAGSCFYFELKSEAR